MARLASVLSLSGAMSRRRHDDAIVSLLAFAWLCRGAWRIARGRAPWSSAR